MLSRNQIFSHVLGIVELMDIAHADLESIRAKMEPHFKDRELTKLMAKEKEIWKKLDGMRKSLRDMRDNPLWDILNACGEFRYDGQESKSVIVGPRVLELIRENGKLKSYKRPKKLVDGGLIVGKIKKSKVEVHFYDHRIKTRAR